jgi:hypothetical protein
MTFIQSGNSIQRLTKAISHSRQENTHKELFQRFNHNIGLPTKEGMEKAIHINR